MSETPVSKPRSRPLSGLYRRARQHPRAFAVTAGAAALVVLGGGGLLAGAAVGTPGADVSAPVSIVPSVSASAAPTPTPTPTPTARPVPAAALAAQPVRTCSIAEAASDSRLGTFSGSVRNATTGEVLYDHSGGVYSRTASVMKVLTSAAALAVLGPDYRASTTVVAGTEPGQVVLVGGGDITLASGSSNIYPGAASMLDLAAQVNASLAGAPVTSIVLDSSAFAGDAWQPSWNRKELFDGWSSEVTALQVDGDRENPSSSQSARSEDPIGRAGAAFASALGATGASITQGIAPAGAATLGQVQSAPVSTMVQDALIRSDNTEAEMLARLTAIAQGSGNTFQALGASTPAALASYGLDTAGLVIVDGSGLSDDNGVSPNFLTALFAKIAAREGNLGIIADGLPVAGETGTLAGRFTGSNSDAAGRVIAKTGWIDTGYTLSGIITAADGSVLTFAFFALDNVSDSSKQALDTVTAAAYRCGNTLSNL